MKLKKIASLALAGIMAVSMLAGCKDGGNGNSGSSSTPTTPASGYAATILADTNDAQKYMTAGANTKIDQAVAAIATTGGADNINGTTLTAWTLNAGKVSTAKLIMTGANYWQSFNSGNTAEGSNSKNVNMLVNKKDGTFYSLYYVDKKVGDTMIDNLVANELDRIVKADIADQNIGAGDSYSYTVDIAKADWADITEKVKAGAVVIGIAITVDYTGTDY